MIQRHLSASRLYIVAAVNRKLTWNPDFTRIDKALHDNCLVRHLGHFSVNLLSFPPPFPCSVLGMEARVRRHWTMERVDLEGDGGRGLKRGGITDGGRREDEDGSTIWAEWTGSSPLEESERCMTVWIPGSILTQTPRGVASPSKEKALRN
jgi:hypothetical protein